ncbi:hypothetical protein CERZMDRAFT_102632 [Cercospora zeae-maydis SCOH1-5]|uniref:Uncharacterized protein n=1 Tax=Cercospora zeae-maydis SCOH1-5 TaxID=717836 RepID=A0A6A6F1E1_9PEZI|nr:hypothetical protein CERZMDRAFT_102632 [Cercospora zeae-maydis SCOH1-5]
MKTNYQISELRDYTLKHAELKAAKLESAALDAAIIIGQARSLNDVLENVKRKLGEAEALDIGAPMLATTRLHEAAHNVQLVIAQLSKLSKAEKWRFTVGLP